MILIWYEIKKCKDIYVVFKNVEHHGIASKGIFRGLRSECENYCINKNIKLGKENAKEVKDEN